MTFSITFILVIVIPTAYFMDGNVSKYLVLSIGIIFATLTSTLVFTIPKILARNEAAAINNGSTGTSKAIMTCPHCGKAIRMNPTEISLHSKRHGDGK
jgi:hypothetical protein